MIVGELASFSPGGLRLRDGDILVVRTSRYVSDTMLEGVRKTYEAELTRLGILVPKVLAVSGEISLEVIERS